MTRLRAQLLPAALGLVLVAACTGTGGSAGIGSPSAIVPTASPPAEPSGPTPVPAPSGGGGGVPGGGGQPGDSGSGGPILVDPNPGGNPDPTLVTPVAGLAGIHPVSATELETAVDGRHVSAKVSWWSGVEPCSVLAGVDVARDGTTITLTVSEGSAAAPDTVCIEIAKYKATIVDLGELEPGSWTVAAAGEARPVTVTID